MSSGRITVSYGGGNGDIVYIQSASGTAAADITLDKLHEYQISPNGALAAVRCGINSGGDGILLYGLYWQPDASTGLSKAVCDGVLRFIPADGSLSIIEVIPVGLADANVRVITGRFSDVYTQFHWDGAARSWTFLTRYYSGWRDAVISVSLGQTVNTTQPGGAPGYTASYLHLRQPVSGTIEVSSSGTLVAPLAAVTKTPGQAKAACLAPRSKGPSQTTRPLPEPARGGYRRPWPPRTHRPYRHRAQARRYKSAGPQA